MSNSERNENTADGDGDFDLSVEDLAKLTNVHYRIARRKRPAEVPRTFKGRTVVRIASWNMLSFTKWKARNVGVREVVCMTILENRFGIIACQELAESGALELIRDELNNPTTPNVKNWQGHRGTWECVTSSVAGMMYRSRECNGFLWDTSRDISLTDQGLLQLRGDGEHKKKKKRRGRKKKDFARRPFFGYFKVYRFDFILVSVHLKATGLDGEDLSRLEEELDKVPDILDAIDESMPDEKDIIIVGDFNLNPTEDAFDEFREAGFKNAIDGKTPTNISKRHMDGSKTYDNIWILQGNPDKQEYTGRSGVVREGLTHQLIPHKGWEPNGVVSDHCPIWAEFFYGKDYDASTGNEELSLAASKRYKVEHTEEQSYS